MESSQTRRSVRQGSGVGAAIALLGIGVGVTVASLPRVGMIMGAHSTRTWARSGVHRLPEPSLCQRTEFPRWNRRARPVQCPLALQGTACSSIVRRALFLAVDAGTVLSRSVWKTAPKIQSVVRLRTIDIFTGYLLRLRARRRACDALRPPDTPRTDQQARQRRSAPHRNLRLTPAGWHDRPGRLHPTPPATSSKPSVQDRDDQRRSVAVTAPPQRRSFRRVPRATRPTSPGNVCHRRDDGSWVMDMPLGTAPQHPPRKSMNQTAHVPRASWAGPRRRSSWLSLDDAVDRSSPDSELEAVAPTRVLT